MDESKIPVSAQFIDTYFPTIDGVIRTVHSYAEYLNPRAGCTVVAPRAAGYTDTTDYPVLRTPGFRVPFIGYSCPTPSLSYRVKAKLQNGGYELFHAHSPFTLGSYALHMARALEIPVVATFHTKYYDDVKRLTGSTLIAEMVTKKIVRFYESVDSVWSVNSATAGTLRDYGYKGEIFTINNGSDFIAPDNKNELAARAAAELSLTTGAGAPRILLFTGHLIWQKNLRLILDTVKLLLNRRFNLVMLFVGTGYNEMAIKNYAASLDLGERVRFVGQVKDRELLCGIYAAADLLFFPSLYDNAPLVVREAAALGTPALLTRGSNAADGITDGENGYLADENAEAMRDKIIEIFSDFERYQIISKRAAETIPVGWDRILPEVIAKYREVISEFAEKRQNIPK